MEIEKKSTEYRIIKHDELRMSGRPSLSIYVNVSEERGGLTILGRDGDKDFVFEKSKPEVVEFIGNALLEAAKLGKNAEEEDFKRMPF